MLDALLGALDQAGVTLASGHRVLSIERDEDGFDIQTSEQPMRAKRVIVATGGRSLPRTGSDGYGYELVANLGHTVTPTTPALVPLVLEPDHWLTKLSGIAVDVTLTLSAPSGKAVYRQAGAMLLTHFGLSGPAVMDMSRHWIAARHAGEAVQLHANLTGQDFAHVERVIQQAGSLQPRATAAGVLRQWVPERLAEALCRHGARVDPSTAMGRLTREARRALVHALTALPLAVVGDRGFAHAEVTAGGVPLEQVDLRTMASRICPGLFLCGEILNVDGRIGGYNFQWAWCTGRLAGLAAAVGVGDARPPGSTGAE